VGSRLSLGWRTFISLLLISSGVFSAAQNHPARIPKVLYSCDTAGVLGCFPLVRDGDKSYTLGNPSKAGFAGEATITVERFDAGGIALSYKDDANKTATFTGKLQGGRIQGTATSTTMTGAKGVKLDGKWFALVVTDATDLSSRLPAVMNVCQTNDDDSGSPKEDCFSWSWDAKSPVFAGNLVTMERFDAGVVIITGMNQRGTGGLAAYTGKIEGGRILGTVDYFSGDGQTWKGKWTATFAASPIK
jgi:hypothetical protein